MPNISAPPALPLSGGCLCGAVRYSVTAAPIATGLCHCNHCQPQSGSALSIILILPRDGITINGATAVFDDIGSSGLPMHRRFCRRCGSPITTEPDVAPHILFLKAGTLDRSDWLMPTMELFVGRRQAWVPPVPGATQYAGNPPI